MLRTFFIRNFMPYRKENRLRHVLYLGTLMSKQAEAFYRDLAEQTDDEQCCSVLQKIADEKASQLAYMQNELARLKPMPVSYMELDILDIDGALRGLFLNLPDAAEGLTESISFALDQEQKMASLYADLYDSRANPWKSVGIEDRSIAVVERLKGIFDEGKEHVQALTEMLAKAASR